MSDKAKLLLVHYFQTVWEKAGLRWDADNVAEVEAIVDELLEEARDDADTRRREASESARGRAR